MAMQRKVKEGDLNFSQDVKLLKTGNHDCSRFLFVSGDKDFWISRWKNEDSPEGERKDKGTTYTKTQLQVGFASHLIII